MCNGRIVSLWINKKLFDLSGEAKRNGMNKRNTECCAERGATDSAAGLKYRFTVSEIRSRREPWDTWKLSNW